MEEELGEEEEDWLLCQPQENHLKAGQRLAAAAAAAMGAALLSNGKENVILE